VERSAVSGPFLEMFFGRAKRSGGTCGFFPPTVHNENLLPRHEIEESSLTFDSLRYIVRYIENRRRNYVWTRQI
jgi:hypothetical protein